MTGFPSFSQRTLGRNFSIDSVIEEWTTSRGKSLVPLKSFTESRSIAKELCLSVETISSYRTNIPLKTKMKNIAEITYHVRHPEQIGGLIRTFRRPSLP
jgi:hypothetical protein